MAPVPDPNGCKATVNADQIQFQGPEVIHVSSDSDSDDDVDINGEEVGLALSYTLAYTGGSRNKTVEVKVCAIFQELISL